MGIAPECQVPFWVLLSSDGELGLVCRNVYCRRVPLTPGGIAWRVKGEALFASLPAVHELLVTFIWTEERYLHLCSGLYV